MSKLPQGAHAGTAMALAIGLIALPAAAAPGHGADARAATVPGLTISISDGQAAARTGQVLTYRVSLRNTGTATAARLSVSQTLSAGLAVTWASDDGARHGGRVSWSTTLPAGGTRTFRVVARVMKPPAQLLRLAAVACVTLPGDRQPIVCAAHLDRLPGVSTGPARDSGLGHPGLSHPGLGLLPWAMAALALLAGCLLMVRASRRRKSRGIPAG